MLIGLKVLHGFEIYLDFGLGLARLLQVPVGLLLGFALSVDERHPPRNDRVVVVLIMVLVEDGNLLLPALDRPQVQ